jgi:hypothetical protein
MKIEPGHIDKKEIAGTTKDGKNVVYIATHGGLHAFFIKSDSGEIVAIGAAPHKAIGKFLAEKKEPGIKWKEDFLGKSEAASKEDLFLKFRKFMFTDVPLQKTEQTDIYLVYRVDHLEIVAMKKHEVIESLKSGTISKYDIIRDINAFQKASCIKDHEDFEGVK